MRPGAPASQHTDATRRATASARLEVVPAEPSASHSDMRPGAPASQHTDATRRATASARLEVVSARLEVVASRAFGKPQRHAAWGTCISAHRCNTACDSVCPS
uniref:Uncharacterized protein n=1 Tax=Ixodes ricinus TaxID=34613 RepID=A0A6B0UAA5_IXORI